MKLRPRLSPTLDRFLGGHFLGPFFVCLAAFTAAYLLGDIFDRFDDLMRYGGFGLLGLEYFALKIPLIVSQLLPVASLAGVLLGFALLNRTGEVLACQQLGISRFEMAVPVLLRPRSDFARRFRHQRDGGTALHSQASYLYQVQLQKRENSRHLLRPPDLGARDRRLHRAPIDYDGHQKTLMASRCTASATTMRFTQVVHAPIGGMERAVNGGRPS